MDDWNTRFLFGPGLFSGAVAVSFQGGVLQLPTEDAMDHMLISYLKALSSRFNLKAPTLRILDPPMEGFEPESV